MERLLAHVVTGFLCFQLRASWLAEAKSFLYNCTLSEKPRLRCELQFPTCPVLLVLSIARPVANYNVHGVRHFARCTQKSSPEVAVGTTDDRDMDSGNMQTNT